MASLQLVSDRLHVGRAVPAVETTLDFMVLGSRRPKRIFGLGQSADVNTV